MGCSCSCDVEMPSVYWESKPKARKNYICCECGSEISPGEEHHLLKGVWEGDFHQYRTCSICHQVRDAAAHEGFECLELGCLWENTGVEFENAI